jgi:RHS repeat-associated protein
MTNTSGALVWRAEHTPFGGIYALTVGTTANNLRFPGQYYDGETGLAQNWQRDYSPRLGRYNEPAPASLLVQQALYPYVSSDPTGFFDTDGLQEQCCYSYQQHKPKLPTLGQDMASVMDCIQACYGCEGLTITSTSAVSPQHPAGTPHTEGLACDIHYPSKPKKALCCAAACGVQYAQDEKEHPSPHSTGSHLHIQITIGKHGGRGDLPPGRPTPSSCK